MAEYIKREDAVAAIKRVIGDIDHECKSMMDFYCALRGVPAADVEEVRHGRWIHDINNQYGCSECMRRETMSPKRMKPYCPNCGARMDKEE